MTAGGGGRATRTRLPFELADHERGRTADDLWEAAIGDLRDDGRARGRRRPGTRSSREYDQYSLYEFLRGKGWSEGRDRVLRRHELRRGRHAQLARRGPARGPRRRVRRHAGDRGRHGRAAQRVLRRSSQDEVRFGAEVFAIDQDPDGVTVHFKTEAGRFTVRGDYAVCTLPFSVLRTIEVAHAVLARASSGRSASSTTTPRPRSCSRSASASGRTRTASSAARTVTDLPIRRHELPDARPDHQRAACCSPPTPGARTRSSGARWTRRRASRRRSTTWRASTRASARCTRSAPRTPGTATAGRAARSRCSRPEQQTELQADIVRPEGRIHFAGEHCSLYHAWIQGALESGIRAAQAIHEAPASAPVTDRPCQGPRRRRILGTHAPVATRSRRRAALVIAAGLSALAIAAAACTSSGAPQALLVRRVEPGGASTAPSQP